MGLFSDIYNTVAKFFRPQEDIEDASKSVATNRLKLVLMQDRTNLTPKVLEQMRSELIDLLSKYLEMDKDLLELNFEQEGNQVALMLSIPVIRAKDEDEIIAETKNDENEEESDENCNLDFENNDIESSQIDNSDEDSENTEIEITQDEIQMEVVSTPEKKSRKKQQDVEVQEECSSEI